MEGNGGNDALRGDSFQGGYSAGSDTLRGGPGNDSLWGDDDWHGGSGADSLDGGTGTNTVNSFGGTNTLIVTGTPAVDTVVVAPTTAALNAQVTTYSNIQLVRFVSNGGDDQVTR